MQLKLAGLFMMAILLLASQSARAKNGTEPLIPIEASFTKNSQKNEYDIVKGEKKTIEEKGEKDGWKYSFFHSGGSGTIAGDRKNDISFSRLYDGGDNRNWHVGCKKDVMNDSVLCSATRKDINLLVFYSRKTSFIVSLLGDKYPGSNISIRVDEGKVTSANENQDFNKQQSLEILQSIKDGSTVATRYIDWPYNKNIDKSTEVYGLSVVMDYLHWVVNVVN